MKNSAAYRDIAILGGAGFLGRHLSALIKKKSPTAKVRLIDLQQERPNWASPEVEYLGGRNIQDSEGLVSAISGADAVVNLVGLISSIGVKMRKGYTTSIRLERGTL